MEIVKSSLKKNRFDWVLMVSVLGLILIGTLAIISSTEFLSYQSRIIRTHFIAIGVGIFFMLVLWTLNYQIFQDQWKYVYFISLVFLAGVLFFGVVDKGSKSWYRLPFFSIQPSEFSRIGLILVLANYLATKGEKIKEISGLFFSLILIFPFLFLLLKQPDFSGVLITVFAILILLYCGGANLWHIYTMIVYVALSGLFPLIWAILSVNPDVDNFIIDLFLDLSTFSRNTFIFIFGIFFFAYILWRIMQKFNPNLSVIYFFIGAIIVVSGFLSGIYIKRQIKDYQYKRIEVFLYPEKDPRGAGYNILQARIAIGSGGLFGKGFFSGSQARLGFVPERHTDFILSVVGEEMGFIGLLVVIFLYLIILYRIRYIAMVARDRFGYYVACGIFALFLTYFFINFSMIFGFFPVAGVPLPLVSYGGSNLVATLSAIGILQSIYARRYSIT